MNAHHAVVWIDHNEAKIFKFRGDDEIEKLDLHATTHHHLRNRAAVSGRREVDAAFLHTVAEALTDAEEFLVVGPAHAKLALIKHIHHDHPTMDSKLVGVETVDHPTDGQIVAYARKYFHKADRMR